MFEEALAPPLMDLKRDDVLEMKWSGCGGLVG